MVGCVGGVLLAVCSWMATWFLLVERVGNDAAGTLGLGIAIAVFAVTMKRINTDPNPIASSERCRRCNGTGEVANPDTPGVTCWECGGDGRHR
jgi:hypothetical protein